MTAGAAESLGLFHAAWRVVYVLLGWSLVWVAWRRPRAGFMVVALVTLNLLAMAAYLAPCERPWGTTGVDRLVNLSSAAVVAAGGSPWEGAQIGFPTFEPLWDVVVATLSGFDPARTVAAYYSLSPLVLLLVAFGIFFGLGLTVRFASEVEAERDRWERMLATLAVLGLTSISMIDGPIFWFYSFIGKPNHGASFAVWGVLLGLCSGTAPFWVLGGVLGLLAWVHIVDWGFALVALTVGVLLQPDRKRHLWRWGKALLVAVLVAAPYVIHLAQEFNPFRPTLVSAQGWRSAGNVSQRFLAFDRMTLDLGLLLVLGLLGAAVLVKRGQPRDRMILGMLLTGCSLAILDAVVVLWYPMPYPNKIEHFLRFTLALCSAAALARGAGIVSSQWAVTVSRAHLLVVAVCLPLTFPAYWSSSHDRYFAPSLKPLPPRYAVLAKWVRESTPPTAVFATMGRVSLWLPALSGRRVVTFGPLRPPNDNPQRVWTIETLYGSADPRLVRRAADRYQVSHVVIDPHVVSALGRSEPAAPTAYRLVFRGGRTKVYEVVR